MELKGIRVLVTGAGGFIGSHLCEQLVREGCQVNAFVRYKSDGSLGWLDRSTLKTEIEVFAGDVTDTDSIRKAMHGCEVAFHLAALIGIPYSYQAPQSYVRTNVEGTLNVLTAARDMGLKRIIHTSTSEVYGTPETVPITETHPLRAQSPYAATKIAADKLSESFYNSFELPVTVLRPFNTYGPRQSTRAVMPIILTQLLSGSSQIKLGALETRRDLTFVTDTANGFVMAAKSDKAIGKTVQLGTGRDISIGELASLAMNVTGHKAEVICDDKRLRPPQSEVERLLSKPELAKELLGWHALVSLEDGIDRTAKWLKENMTGYKIGQYAV